MIIEEPTRSKTEVWRPASEPPEPASDWERFLVVVRDGASGAGELLLGHYTELRDGRKIWLLEDDGQWSQDHVTHWRPLPALP